MNSQKFYFVLFTFLISSLIFGQDKLLVSPPPPPNPDFSWEMNKETEAEYLKNISEYVRKQLEEIKKINAKKYNDLLQKAYFKSLRFPFYDSGNKEMTELDQKILELDIHTEALATKYSEANNSEKKKIERELKKQLNKLFELKEKRKNKEVEKLEEELANLKKGLRLREENKDKIIERRLLELLGQDDYLEW